MDALRKIARRASRAANASFCEQCGEVCDDRCRSQQLADRRRELTVRAGLLPFPR
jgi:hypothetical protein